MPAPELRCRLSAPIMGKLSELQQHLGHQYRAALLEYLIVDAHQRLLRGTTWEQQQLRAYRVLKRLRPSDLLTMEEILGVSFLDGGDRVCIHVALNAQPYQVSKKEWEK